MKEDWCKCPDEETSGHLQLESVHPVGSVYVHGKCLLPSFSIWQKHEDFCDECGRSFSGPDSICWRCGGRSWSQTADQHRNFIDLRDAHFFMRGAQKA